MLYNVSIEGRQHKNATICLGKDGVLLVMDSDGKRVLEMAERVQVRGIGAMVIVMDGFIRCGTKHKYVEILAVYAEKGVDDENR